VIIKFTALVGQNTARFVLFRFRGASLEPSKRRKYSIQIPDRWRHNWTIYSAEVE